MRKGIVAGEPGMFPWPFGRLYGWLGARRRGSNPPSDPTAAPDAAGSGAAEEPPGYEAGGDQTRPARPEGP